MRLIDADSLLKHLFVTESRTGGSVYAQAYEQGWDDALKAVMENEPTVADVVDIVRCKDCRWFGEYGCAIRIVDESDKPKENDYCSFGERGESECQSRMRREEKMPDKLVDAFIETVKGGEETIKACEKLLSLSYEELAEEIERMRKEQDAQVGRKGESDEH